MGRARMHLRMLEHMNINTAIVLYLWDPRERKISNLMLWKNNDFTLYLLSLCSVPIKDIFTDNNNEWVSLAIWLSDFMFKWQIYDVQKHYVNYIVVVGPDHRNVLLINEYEVILLITSHSILLCLSIFYCFLPNFTIR